MAKRLISATRGRLPALALVAALSACATPSAEPRTGTLLAGWRIVERTGEARHSPPDAEVWVPATTGEALAEGSEIATGRGGRLIVDAPGRHISVGPDSRFVLPDEDRDGRLTQRAGWIRYRIAAAGTGVFRIQTRALELELAAGVVDVHVDHLATEVTVKEGQVRVATPDGLRRSQMVAGQSAQAGGGAKLAVQAAPGEALQPVAPVIVPAINPIRAPAEATAIDAPASAAVGSAPARASLEPVGVTLAPDRAASLVLRRASATAAAAPHATARSAPSTTPPATKPGGQQAAASGAPQLARAPQAATPETVLAPGPAEPSRHPAKPELAKADARPGIIATAVEAPVVRSAADALVPADAVVPAVAPASRPTDPATIRRSKLDRLTAGLIDGIEPLHPVPIRR